MALRLCLNAHRASPLLFEQISPDKTAFSYLLDKLLGFGQWGEILICAHPDMQAALTTHLSAHPITYRFLLAEQISSSELIAQVFAQLSPEDKIVWLRADAVLSSMVLLQRLLEQHDKYLAEFSFAEGYPLGYAPSLINAEILPALQTLTSKQEIDLASPSFLFDALKPDVNAFEIETMLASRDLRLLRVNLHVNQRRNFDLCKKLLSASEKNPEEFEAYIEDHQLLLRTLPAFMNVQIVEKCPQACSYCPYGLRHGQTIGKLDRYMTRSDFSDLCRRFAVFAPDSFVSLSLWGEASMHPEIYQILEDAETYPGLGFYVETSGIGWDIDKIKALKPQALKNITWIVSLDTLDPNVYQEMRGQGFAEAFVFAQNLSAWNPDNVYIQAVRTTINEDSLPHFHAFWKERKAKFIFQKYDHFSHSLPDLRISDIAPLKRAVCWHLKRDLNILVDGRVSRCREDLDASDALGNALNEGIDVIWERMSGIHKAHTKGEFTGICKDCDEHYTFNA